MARYRRSRKPAKGTLRRQKWYYYLKNQIIEFLGGCCSQCGSTTKLEFDHISGYRDWEPDQVHSTKRMRIYKQEALNDELQLLCKSCNSAKSDSPEDDNTF